MLFVHLFDQLRVLVDGAPLKLSMPPKTIPLWAHLLLHPGPLSRDKLAGQLWPDESEAGARANLRRHLYHLQRALPQPPADQPWLLIGTDSLGWNQRADYWLDVAEFERLSGDPAGLVQAVELYTGDLLHTVDDELLIYERERLRERYFAILYELLLQARRDRAQAAAVTYATRILVADPLREDALRQLLAVRYESGDRAGALREYARFAHLLREEIGADPMPETVALHDAIRRNERLPGSAPEIVLTEATGSGPLKLTLPFAGREPEVEQLRARWRHAVAGAGSLVLVSGEAGVGKSRLAAECALQADVEGGRVLLGGSTFAEPVPYQAVAQALREALPLVAALNIDPTWLSALLPLLPGLRGRRPDLRPLPALEPAQDRARLHEALVRCLAGLAQPRPVLLVLEDLHWAGAATVDFLSFLAERVQEQRLLVIATYREEEVGRDHPLRALRRQIGRAQAGMQIALQRLPASATRALLAGVVSPGEEGEALARRLYAESEGNPLFLAELLRDWLESPAAGSSPDTQEPPAAGLPSGVETVIAGRLARLSPLAQSVVEVAAVVGAGFNVEVVRDAGGWSDGQVLDSMGEMLDRQLAHEATARSDFDYVFAHHLIQETVYRATAAAALQRRHRRVAQVLEDLYPARHDELAARLALHFDLGADAVHAVPYYRRAAEVALRVYADAEALGHLARALDLSPGEAELWPLLLLREQVHGRRGDRAAQEVDVQQLEILAAGSGDPARIGEALCRRIMLQRARGEREAEAATIGLLNTHAASSGDERLRGRALQLAAEHQLLLNQYDAARELGERSLEAHRALGSAEDEAAALALLAEVATHQGRLAETHALLEQAMSMAESLRAPSLLVNALASASTAAVVQQDYRLGEELSRRMLDLTRTIGDRDGEATAHARLATHLMRLFKVAEAREHYALAAALYDATGNRRGQAIVLVNSGALDIRLGRYAEVLPMLEKAEALFGELDDLRGQAVCAGNIVQTANTIGDFERARTAAERGLRLAREIGNPAVEASILANLGATERGLGNLAAAIQHMESGLAIRRAIGQPIELIRDLCDLTLTYLQAGRLDDARRAGDELVGLRESAPEQLDFPQHDLWAAACVARAAGDHETARRYLDRAHAAYLEQHQTIPDPESRQAFGKLSFNQDLLAAHEQGIWPGWTNPH